MANSTPRCHAACVWWGRRHHLSVWHPAVGAKTTPCVAHRWKKTAHVMAPWIGHDSYGGMGVTSMCSPWHPLLGVSDAQMVAPPHTHAMWRGGVCCGHAHIGLFLTGPVFWSDSLIPISLQWILASMLYYEVVSLILCFSCRWPNFPIPISWVI